MILSKPLECVLGPDLFLFYIYDIPELLRAKVRLYTDDTVVYQTILLNDDAEAIEIDLQKLGE